LQTDEKIKMKQLNKENWELVKLGDVCEVIAGQSPESSFYNKNGDGTPFFQGKADFTDTYPEVRYYTQKVTKLAQENDILLSVRAPVGPTNICNVDSCIGRGLSAIRSKESTYFKYVYYHFKSIEKKL
jgi:restriction endonuclease S subunit